MGAVSILILAALNAAPPVGASAMECGFPSIRTDEPAIHAKIAISQDIYNIPGTVGVQIVLNSGARLPARAQYIGTPDQSTIMIAGSPIDRVYYTIALHSDGTAALTIQDLRQETGPNPQVTRRGTCRDHQALMERVQNY